MAGKYPHIEPLRELRYSLSKLRLNDLAVGHDHRNRAPLWAYGTKTGRNAPGASQFVFGPAKWLRFLITPPPGASFGAPGLQPARGAHCRGAVWR